MAHGEEIVRLMREVEVMPGYHRYQQIHDLGVSTFTLLGNYAELEGLILALCGPSAPPDLWYSRNRDRQMRVLLDIARRLHNFVAASSSLIDHTRSLRRHLNEGKGSKPFPDYQQRIDRDFRLDPLSQFVQGLRQYCQHYRMPAITLTTEIDVRQGGVTHTIFLQKAELLRFSNWNAPAKQYLNTIPGHVPLLDVASAYRNKVEAFHAWFRAREEAIFADEIHRFETKEQRRVLLVIEDEIDACQAGASPLSKDDCFLSVFLSQDYTELATTPPDSLARADKVIELLRRHFAIPDALQAKIKALYAGEAASTPQSLA